MKNKFIQILTDFKPVILITLMIATLLILNKFQL